MLHGDACSETRLADLFAAAPLQGARDLNIELAYEYGSRVGFWRLMRIFAERQVPLTIYAVGMALERNPHAAEAMACQGCEIVGHGWRWLDYRDIDEATEREHIRLSVELIRSLVGVRPVGWYVGTPSANTRRLVVEEGGFLYDSDAYNDELPYWTYSIADRILLFRTRSTITTPVSRAVLVGDRPRISSSRCATISMPSTARGVGTQVDDRRGPLPPRRQAGSRSRFRTVHRSCAGP